MMTAKQLLRLALELPGAYEDYPFGPDWAVLRHRGNKKIFCMLFVWPDGSERANLKCEPMQADFWRGAYKSVLPGYHMNKTHWNTVILDSELPAGEIEEMLRHSYEQTRPKSRRQNRKNRE